MASIHGSIGGVWIRPPSQTLIPALGDYQRRAITAVLALAAYFAQKLQDESRQNAPWQDRTGNARSGLFAVTEQAAGDLVTIYLSHGHTVDYGKFLELAHGAKYAIIMPTIERNLPEIEAQLKRLLA